MCFRNLSCFLLGWAVNSKSVPTCSTGLGRGRRQQHTATNSWATRGSCHAGLAVQHRNQELGSCVAVSQKWGEEYMTYVNYPKWSHSANSIHEILHTFQCQQNTNLVLTYYKYVSHDISFLSAAECNAGHQYPRHRHSFMPWGHSSHARGCSGGEVCGWLLGGPHYRVHNSGCQLLSSGRAAGGSAKLLWLFQLQCYCRHHICPGQPLHPRYLL